MLENLDITAVMFCVIAGSVAVGYVFNKWSGSGNTGSAKKAAPNQTENKETPRRKKRALSLQKSKPKTENTKDEG